MSGSIRMMSVGCVLFVKVIVRLSGERVRLMFYV